MARRAPAGSFALRRPSSSSTRSASAAYASGKPVRMRRPSSRSAASSSLVLGLGTPSRHAGDGQLKSLRNSPASTYRRVTARSFASAASSGSSRPRRDRTSLTSSRVASFAAITPSRASLVSHAASKPSFPLASRKMLLRIDDRAQLEHRSRVLREVRGDASDRHGQELAARSRAATHLRDERRELTARVVPDDELLALQFLGELLGDVVVQRMHQRLTPSVAA